MISHSPSQLLETAIAAANRAGNHALNNPQRRREIKGRPNNDLKLQLDIECQEIAEEVILAQYPDHNILGEEGASTGKDSTYEWIIDPIDGTMNFSHGMPYWCCSVAVRCEGEMQAGCVYIPEWKERYTATIDGPALCNGKSIAPTQVREISEAYLLSGMGRPGHPTFYHARHLQRLVEGFQQVRVLGAAAIDVCMVAAGRAEAYADRGVQIWDIAAADLIARRAGARSEILDETPEGLMLYICSNGPMHEALKSAYPGQLEAE